MQGIAYIIDGNPCLAWPAVTETDILDADGNPTGEMQTTDNLDALIAALPPDTHYDLLTEDDAAAWWQAHRPASDGIQAQIVALEARQTPRMVRGAALGNPDDVARLQAIEAEITALRAQL